MVGLRQRMAFVLVVSTFAGCSQYQKLPSADPNVSNGIWSERGAFELRIGDTLVVPAGTQMETTATGKDQVVVFLQKKLHYLGHPGCRVSEESKGSRNQRGQKESKGQAS